MTHSQKMVGFFKENKPASEWFDNIGGSTMSKLEITNKTIKAIELDIDEIRKELINLSTFSIQYALARQSIKYAEEIIEDLKQGIETMSTGNCDICGIWDSGLIDGACQECTNRYSGNFIEARETFKAAIKDPETKIKKLERIASLARCSMVCTLE